MAQRTSVQLEKPQRDAIEDLEDRGLADNRSEAHRMLITAGMREYGYVNGDHADSRLSSIAGEFAKAFVWIGIAWAVMTLFWPVELRTPALFAFLAAIGAIGVKLAVDEWGVPSPGGEAA